MQLSEEKKTLAPVGSHLW